MEIWKAIEGYPNYEVSNQGRVRSLDRITNGQRRKGQILKGGIDSDGYRICLLYREKGKRYTAKIHRLVAHAFLPNPDGKRTVNHKNGVKTDNRSENLEWSTVQENVKHAFDFGLKRSRFQEGERPVLRIDKETGSILHCYSSLKSVTLDGYNRTNVGECCRGHRATHKGFIWCYANCEDIDGFVTHVQKLIRNTPDISRKVKKRVQQIDPKSGELLKEFPSLTSVNKHGFSHNAVSLCCQGKQRLHKGYIWRYAT